MMKLERAYILGLKEFPLMKRGSRSQLVRLIQEWLCLNHLPVVIDGNYGPATEEAIKKFQSLNLPFYNEFNKAYPTGETDNPTFKLLTAPMKIVLDKYHADEKLWATIIYYARLHYKQHPREVGGQNRGPWVRLYMNGSEGKQYPWCAGFVSYIVRQACQGMNVEMPFEYTWSVPHLASQARKKDIFLDGQKGKPNTGYIFLQKSKKGYSHTGFVISKKLNSFTSIEGNTNDDGSAEGYEVCSRTRSYKNKDFVILE